MLLKNLPSFKRKQKGRKEEKSERKKGLLDIFQCCFFSLKNTRGKNIVTNNVQTRFETEGEKDLGERRDTSV